MSERKKRCESRLQYDDSKRLRCGRAAGHWGEHQATHNAGTTTTFWTDKLDKAMG